MLSLQDFSLFLAFCLSFVEFLYFALKFNYKSRLSREDYNRVLYSLFALIVSSILFTSYTFFNQYNVLNKLNVVGHELRELGSQSYKDFMSVAILSSLYGVFVETVSLVFLIMSFISSSPYSLVAVGVAKLSYRSLECIALAGTYISQNMIVIGQFFVVFVFLAKLIFPILYFIGIGILPLKNTRPLGISLILFSLAVGVFLPYIFYNISMEYDFIRKNIAQSPPVSMGWLKIIPMQRIPFLQNDEIVWKNISCPKYTAVRYLRNLEFMNRSVRESYAQYLTTTKDLGKYVRYILVPTGKYIPKAIIWGWMGFPVDYNYSSPVYVNSSKIDSYSLDYLMNTRELKPKPSDKIYLSVVYPKPLFQDGFKFFATDNTIASSGICDFSSGWFFYKQTVFQGILDPKYVSQDRVNVTWVYRNITITLENGTTITKKVRIKKTTVMIEIYGHYRVLSNETGRSFIKIDFPDLNTTYLKYFDAEVSLSESWTKYSHIGLFDWRYKKYDPFKFLYNTVSIINGSDTFIESYDCLFDKIILNTTFLEDIGYPELLDNIRYDYMLIVKKFDIPLITGYRDAIYGIINVTYYGNISSPAKIFVEVINPHTRFKWGDEYLRNCYYCWNNSIVWLYSCEGAPFGIKCNCIYSIHNLTYYLPLEYDELSQFLWTEDNPLYRDLKLLVEDHSKIYGLMIQIFTILVSAFMIIDFLSGLFGGISISGLTYLGIVKKTRFYSSISQTISSGLYSFLDVISRKTNPTYRIGYRALRQMGLKHITALALASKTGKTINDRDFVKKVEKYYLDKVGKVFYSLYRYGLVFHHPLTGLFYLGYRTTKKGAERKGSPLLYSISEKLRTVYFLSTRRPLDLLIFSTVIGAKAIKDRLKSMESFSQLARFERKIIEELSKIKVDFGLKYRALERFYKGYVYSFPFKLKSYSEFLKVYDRYAGILDSFTIQFYEKGAVNKELLSKVLSELKDSILGEQLSRFFRNINIVSMRNYILFRSEQLILGNRDISHLYKLLDSYHKRYIEGFGRGIGLADRDLKKYISNIFSGKDTTYSLGVLKGYYIAHGLENEYQKLLDKVEGRYDLLKYIPFREIKPIKTFSYERVAEPLRDEKAKLFKNLILSNNFKQYSLPYMLGYLKQYYEARGELEQFEKIMENIEGRYDLLSFLPYERYSKTVDKERIPEEVREFLAPVLDVSVIVENLNRLRNNVQYMKKINHEVNAIIVEIGGEDVNQSLNEAIFTLRRGYGSDLLRREYLEYLQEYRDKCIVYRDKLRLARDVYRMKYDDSLRLIPPEYRNEFVEKYKPTLLLIDRLIDELNYRIEFLTKFLEGGQYGG